MRIIGGMYRGRRFNPPSFFKARPTTDFAKESLFNLINNQIDLENSRVLDLFSGTGSISFEFMSRGSEYICSVDINTRYLDYIKKTAEIINPEKKVIHTIKADVLKFVSKNNLDYDVIFADPPYDLPEISKIPALIYSNDTLKKDALVIIEHSSSTNFSEHPNFMSVRKYGSVNFSFFK
jgi:16S rRNA (guanine(966)-N(2))-methyltransferase RsmD